jgi:uncharacterized protein YfaP (DUF2135 family)
MSGPWIFTVVLCQFVTLLLASPAVAECNDGHKTSGSAGVLTVYLESRCRPGQQASLIYEDRNYPVTFDNAGRAQHVIAVLEPSATIEVEYADGPPQQFDVAMPDLNDSILIVLRWDDEPALDLHVVEAGGTLLGNGDVNIHSGRGAGGSRVIDAGGTSGGWHEQIYQVPAQSGDLAGFRKIYVDFRSRGDQATSPYCGQGEAAAPAFDLVVANPGAIRSYHLNIAAMPCGKTLATNQRYVRIRL